MSRSGGRSEASPQANLVLIYRPTAVGIKGRVDLARPGKRTRTCGERAAPEFFYTYYGALITFFVSAGWRGWFVAGLLYPRLRARPRPKSMDFHDAENRQRPCRIIIWHIVRVHYFVRGGFVGHRSRASSKHLSPHLPVGELDSSEGQTGVALHLQCTCECQSTKKPTRCCCFREVTLQLSPSLIELFR
ncbi:hypothetical protein TNCV_4847981 [Trichonephila clavipes]|nr:hypothetical protein TNCV_4847981 [Trichonephila clavipes]